MGWFNKVGLMSVYPLPIGQIAALILDQAVKIQVLVHLAMDLIPENIGLTVITNMLVAICQQGTVSTHFIEKIRQATRVDLGKDVRVTIAVVSAIWGAYGQFIND